MHRNNQTGNFGFKAIGIIVSLIIFLFLSMFCFVKHNELSVLLYDFSEIIFTYIPYVITVSISLVVGWFTARRKYVAYKYNYYKTRDELKALYAQNQMLSNRLSELNSVLQHQRSKQRNAKRIIDVPIDDTPNFQYSDED